MKPVITPLFKCQYLKQKGFGEAFVFPALICLVVCGYLLVPGFAKLFEDGLTLPTISIVIIAVLSSLWLASKLFGDYLNLSILIVFAFVWTMGGGWIVEQTSNDDNILILNSQFLSVLIPGLYVLIHAIILTVINLLQKKAKSNSD